MKKENKMTFSIRLLFIDPDGNFITAESRWPTFENCMEYARRFLRPVENPVAGSCQTWVLTSFSVDSRKFEVFEGQFIEKVD